MKIKKKKLWERGWARTFGIIALSGSLVFTEGFLTYGAAENAQLKSQAVKEDTKDMEEPVEEYLKNCFEQRKESIDMSAYNLSWDELKSKVFKLHYEYPQFYTVMRSSSHTETEDQKVQTYYPNYSLDRSAELKAEWKLVEAKTKDCKTDLEKAMVVHDYLCDTIVYSNELGTHKPHDIEGAILEKKAVCEGYALAYKYYMNRLNIPCNVVEGTVPEGSHAWNQIKIGGKWYMVDTTWDDPRNKDKAQHDYFLCSSAKFFEHTPTPGSFEPCNDTKYDDQFWQKTSGNILGYKGGLYYVGYEHDDSGIRYGVFRYDVETGEKDKQVINITEQWNASATEKEYSAVIKYHDGMLYYNTPKAIWKWNFNDKQKPEKIFDLPQNIKEEIWNIDIVGGTLYYETAEGKDAVRKRHKMALDTEYQKQEQPISVSEKNVTLELGKDNKILQANAAGKLEYTSENPEICQVDVFYNDESCELIPKKIGTTKIRVKAEETDVYKAAETIVTVNVVDDEEGHNVYRIEASLPKTITYGESEKVNIKIVDASTGEEVDAAGKNLKVTTSENLIYKDGKVTAANSGEYSLTITADGVQKVTLKGNVVKRKATVKANSISRDKKDKHIEPTVTVENRADLDKDKEFGISIDCDVNQNTSVGEYPISVSGGNDYFLSRYEPTYIDGTYKITGIESVILNYEAGENGSLKAVKAGTDVALSNGQEIEQNTEVKFTAVPKDGYVVKNWIVNGEVYKENGKVYTGETLSRVIASSNDSVKVEFVKEKKYYQVSAKAVYEDNSLAKDVKITVKDEAGNVFTSESDILEGTKITAEADCPKDINIVKWVINGKDYSSKNTISFVLESDTEVKLVVKQKEEHIHVYDVEKVEDRYKASDATCTEPAKYYKSCACGERSDVTFSFGEALGHDYGEAVWSWSSDNKTAEAVFTCSRDKNHVEKATAEVTSKVTKNPTCTEQGETTYTAKATFGGKVSTDTKTVKDVQALGHKFEYGVCGVCGAADPNYKKYDLENCTWTKGDEKDVVVEIPAEIGEAGKFTIDGKDMEKDSYVVAEGTLTIQSDMLEKLVEGQHIVQIRGEEGYAEMYVIIEKEETVEPPKPDPEQPTEPSEPDSDKPTAPSKPDSGKPTEPSKPAKPNNQGSDTQKKPTKPDNKNQNTDANGVKTGDNSNTLPLIALAGGAMLIGITAHKKREKETEE